jgi:hypothetical protein
MPTSGRRVRWNILMVLATGLVSFGAIWVTLKKTASPGLEGIMATISMSALACLFVIGLIGFFRKNRAGSAG